MPRTSNRRWKGCPMCKYYKFAQQGDGERQGRVLQLELGRSSRINRHDMPDEEVKSPPAKKNRKRWCGGHQGREHTPEMVFMPNGNHVCKWWTYLVGNHRQGLVEHRDWICQHRDVCQKCGKVLGYPSLFRCPDFPSEELEAEKARIDSRLRSRKA